MEKQICQSCGMPMVALEHFGTNRDSSINTEYCCYCYRNGDFIEDLSLEQMIENSLKYPEMNITIDGRPVSDEEAALKYRLQLVTLQRWKLNAGTISIYLKSVNQLIDYIQTHLPEKMDLNQLAGMVNISHYHLHRIFKAVMNENIGEYIQRLRLERTAFKLQTTNQTLLQIAEQVGYQTQYALSKAFKKQFGVAPGEYRKMSTDLTIPIKREECGITEIYPRIEVIPPFEVVYTQVINPYKYVDAFTEAWKRLLRYVKKKGIPDEHSEFYVFSRDVPSVISLPERQRIYVCMNNSDKLKPSGNFGVQTIEGGMYAVFTVYGPYKQLPDAYTYIYRHWLFYGEYQIRDYMVFEKYLNSPDEVEEDQLVTEIYIPVSEN